MNPVLVDLFAGVGGMSLGASRAGFTVGAAYEWDPIAITSHAVNFPNAKHFQQDVALLSGADIISAIGGPLAGLVGGPPCQGFSTIGKRAVDDPRNSLFGHFFRLVQETQPAFFVAENVPGILNERNRDVVAAALRLVPENYKVLAPKILSASNFGVPTSRKRVFFIGYDTRRMATITEEDLFTPLDCDVNVGAALAGLPAIRSSWQTADQGWRTVTYGKIESAFYSRLTGHVPDNVGDANALAEMGRRRVSGNLGTLHDPVVVSRFRAVRPGTTDPISRAPRLTADGYCPTLRAGTNSDRGSFQAVRPIHFSAARVISPREAARLQGFPDWFQFHETKWHSFRQIGNSVSPGVAETLLSRLKAKML